ncbi:hypothetical protein BCR36DRAFT_294501 [Piromyces finnis]|uniref:Right handed beta helix domain-containing protein n=1 Tax=Piromyces finnis TaxID=1754191 RepID=A0A1Y1V5R3_9FUNG|nr:hypothetical protein BCR36DRAFT_294501 [Piromyces finnis]|eukprot:ORX47896.1 hypothetical protein BCR36DRAFT_294501 [Piromyces finnis]
MKNIIETINSKLLTSDVNVIVNDGTYKIPTEGKNHIQVYNTLVFNGKKNSIFDFQYSMKSQFYVHFSAGGGNTEKKLIFNNITFYNFNNFGNDNSNIMSFETENTSDRYTAEFNNCTFLNNKGINANVKVSCIFQIYHYNSYYNLVNVPDCFNIQFKDCHFESNRMIGELYNGRVTFDNCYFTNIYGDKIYPNSFIYSSALNNSIDFINSKLIDNIVQLNKPFFSVFRTSLRIENTIFKNCHSYGSYLFEIRSNALNIEDAPSLIINNSTFNDISTLVEGDRNVLYIKNSRFHNITSLASMPIILNSYISEIFIENTEFKDIT